MSHRTLLVISLMLGIVLLESAARADEAAVERGRYLVAVGGCNDCHTAAFAESAGKVPESEWLLGAPVGYQGPWGTAYAANLRIVAERYTAEQFLARSRSELLPPMPWFNLVQMTDEDLTAVYSFIRSLGPVGEPAPTNLPPGVKATTPYIVFVPQVDVPAPVARN